MFGTCRSIPGGLSALRLNMQNTVDHGDPFVHFFDRAHGDFMAAHQSPNVGSGRLMK